MGDNTFDIVIIGGGIMGSATAYHLTKMDPSLKVALVEKDPSYTYASTPLSAANVRIQFSLKENIQISQYALEVLKTYERDMAVGDEKPPDPTFRQEGNLFLVSEENKKEFEAAYALQKSLGCAIEWWDNDKVKEVYPLYNPEGFIGATFGPEDGHLDANSFLMGFVKKAKSQGVVFISSEAVALETANGRATGVKLADQSRLSAKYVVNCCGAWASRLAATAGVKIPVSPIKRQIYVLDTEVKPQGPLPLTILPSTLYFRTETGGLILLGKSFDEDVMDFDFEWDKDRFVEKIWEELIQFVPAFESLRIINGWAGLYAINTLDYNGILGEWPELSGFYLANGFSGHGLQQGPGVGRYIAELILGKPISLDLSIFSPCRILDNKPISEGGIV